MVLQPREHPYSRAAELYLDILVEDYGGHIPFGEMAQVAERVGLTKKTLYNLNSGDNPEWTRERNRRLEALVSLDTRQQRVYELERLYRHKIAQRTKRQMDWTDKDPLDILGEVRKEYAHEEKVPQQQNALIFQFIQNMSGEELQARLAQVEEMLRSGQYLEETDVIDAEWSDESRAGADVSGSEGRESPALISSGTEET